MRKEIRACALKEYFRRRKSKQVKAAFRKLCRTMDLSSLEAVAVDACNRCMKPHKRIAAVGEIIRRLKQMETILTPEDPNQDEA